MLFSELAHAIHPYLMKDADVPGFMRDLIQRLCDIPEEDWHTKRDPSSDEKYKDGSLRKLYTRGPTKKLARAMLGRLTKDNFINSINFDDDATDVGTVKRESLASAVAPFTDNDKDVNEENVAEILFDLLKLSLEYVIDPDLENDRKLKRAETDSEKAKRNYGAALLEDCKHICSKPGCSQHLQTVASNHQSRNDYEVVCISGERREYDNLIVLCHGCFNSYILKHTKAEEKDLLSIKALQRQISDARQTLRTTDIETGIRKVVENFSRAKGDDFLNLNYDPVTVPEKIDGQTNFFLLDEVMRNVTRYYLFIEKTDKNENKIKEMQEKLESLEGELARKTKEIEDKDNKIKDLEKALDEKDNKIKELENKKKETENSKSECFKKIEELQKAIDSLKESSENTKKELEDKIKELEEKQKTSEEEIKKLKEDLDKKIEEAKKLIEEANKKAKEEIEKQTKDEKDKNLNQDLSKKLDELLKLQKENKEKKEDEKSQDKKWDEILKADDKNILNQFDLNKMKKQGEKQVKDEKEFAVFQVDKNFYNIINKDGKTTVYMDVKTYVDQGRTMIPVRYIAYTLGFNVEYDNSTREAIFSNKENNILAKKTLRLNIDTGVMKDSDGKVYNSDVKPVIINGRIHASISNIAKAFGASHGDIKDGKNQTIEWDNARKAVYVFKNVK